MCVTSGRARLSRTILYGAEIGRVHVLGYQNKAVNLDNTPNAMILPFPAVPGSMSQRNVVNTAQCPKILEDMSKALTPLTKGVSFGSPTRGLSMAHPRVEVFNHGIYTVILAEDASAIPSALSRVPQEKRPPLNVALFEAYSAWYPAWAIALCCFNNRDSKDATPMLWWYEPSDGGELFLPTLDCHTGEVPDLNEQVALDHTVAVGSDKMRYDRGVAVTYSDPRVPQHVQSYVLRRLIGGPLNVPPVKNGDLFINIPELREGVFNPERRDPLGVTGW